MNNIASLNALQAYGTRQTVAANNVANVNTNGFKPSQVNLEEGPEGQGVRVQEIRKQGNETQEANQVQGTGRMQQSQNQEGTARAAQNKAPNQPSGTSVETEMVNVLQSRTAYAANAAVVKTNDQMAGELLNKMV